MRPMSGNKSTFIIFWYLGGCEVVEGFPVGSIIKHQATVGEAKQSCIWSFVAASS